MKTTSKYLIALVALLGMTVGCASNSPPPDEEPYQLESGEPMEEPPAMQEPEPSEPTPPAPEPSDDLQPVEPEAASADSVRNSEIDAFVDTYREVTQVRQAYQERMSRAPTSDEARALQQEAFTAIRGVIERGELEPERFAQIANLAETDPEVARQIRDRMANGSGDS